MFNSKKIISELKDNKLELDCTSMILSQRKNDGISFEGKGYVRQSQEGLLTFKIYASIIRNTDQYKFMQSLMSPEHLGKLYPKDELYDLEFIRHDGTRWAAQEVIPSCSWTSAGDAIVTGDLRSICTQWSSDRSRAHLTVHFFGEVDVPLTLVSKTTTSEGIEHYRRDRAKFSALGCEFEVHKDADELAIEADSHQQLPESLYLRVQESLHYLTAKPVAWRARLEQKDAEVIFEVTSKFLMSENTRLSPPIRCLAPGFFEDGWKLFGKYLEYVVGKTSGTYWSHCGYHMHNACEASANSIDAWAIGVSVAVEGIACLIETAADRGGEARLDSLQHSLREFVDSRPEFSEFAERLKGLIGSLGIERVKDKLRPLETSGHVNPEYIRSWEKLRNRQVHPKVRDLSGDALSNLQELLHLVQEVEVLMWQITFYLIGYSGKFSDSGRRGFAVRDYPLGSS